MNPLGKALDAILGKNPVAEESTRPLVSETERMRAIVWHGARKVSCELVPKPLITHPEDVIVRITSCTICSGSDSHMYSGEIPDTKVGQILGHEGMGIISAVGDGVTKFHVGDRVVIAFDIACGKCEYCQRKEFTGCQATNDSEMCKKWFGQPHAAIFGYGDLLGGVPGTQAEFVRVPFADTTCYRVPDELPDERALFMTDILCTSLHALDQCNLREGDSVAIWGLGPIGLLAARWAQIRGARKIIGIDLIPERLEAAVRLGIDVIDRNALPTGTSVPDAIMQRIPEGVDCSVEAVGFRFSTTLKHKVERAVGLETDTSDIVNECLQATRKFGRISLIADYAGLTNHFAIGHLQMKHLTICGGQTPCQNYFDTVSKTLLKGELNEALDLVVTHRIPFEEIPAAYDKLFYKKDGYIKVFVKMDSPEERVRDAS